MLKAVLVGYPGSQCIVKASKYLTEKYVPVNCIYLNYKGDVNLWSHYVSDFLSFLTDEFIIFALDDYLIADYIDETKLSEIISQLNSGTVCIKLCHSTPEEHEEYPATTQWCIWRREFLIWLLVQPETKTPWEFEINGSKILKQQAVNVVHAPCLNYFTNSSISKRWEGIRLDGLKKEDIDYITQNHLINE